VFKGEWINCMRAKVVGLPPPCRIIMAQYSVVPSTIISFKPYESANPTIWVVDHCINLPYHILYQCAIA
jgi:hypothetical protein